MDVESDSDEETSEQPSAKPTTKATTKDQEITRVQVRWWWELWYHVTHIEHDSP